MIPLKGFCLELSLFLNYQQKNDFWTLHEPRSSLDERNEVHSMMPEHASPSAGTCLTWAAILQV